VKEGDAVRPPVGSEVVDAVVEDESGPICIGVGLRVLVAFPGLDSHADWEMNANVPCTRIV
jgi:hypothetical protein